MAITPTAHQEIWRKWTILPIIIARQFLMGLATGLYSVSIYNRYRYDFYADPPVFAAVLLLALILIIFVADLIHLLLYARNKLRPSLFLVTNIAQICCWAGVVVLDLAVIAKGRGMRNKFFPILVSLSFINALVYAIYIFVTYRKVGKLGHYNAVNNPASVPLNNVQYYQPQAGHGYADTSYQAPAPVPAHSPAPVGLGVQPAARPQGAAADYYNSRKV